MKITDLIEPAHVIAGLRAVNKSQLLRELARRAGEALGVGEPLIFAALETREQLGSTGVGDGIAMPHAQLENLTRFFGLFAKLDRPIDFGSIDGRPVDLVFMLLSPTSAASDRLAALASVARRLRVREVAQCLRATKDAAQLYEILSGSEPGAPAGI